MLEDSQSRCRKILRKSDTFGNLLYDFLSAVLPMDRIIHLIEIGGGYGFLMRDFLRRNRRHRATMIDLSPFLLAKQREMLREFPVQFKEGDFLEINGSVLHGMELAILNEVMGDLPTVCQITQKALMQLSCSGDQILLEAKRICDLYRISPPEGELLCLNIGAIQALEKLCKAEIPHIYASEHSCEASVPIQLRGLLELAPTGEPERIRLRGHNEYTVRFSDLKKVADRFGYAAMRGQYIDFIEPVIDGDVEFILRVGASRIDWYEIVQQFIEDLAKYEYLILSRDDF